MPTQSSISTSAAPSGSPTSTSSASSSAPRGDTGFTIAGVADFKGNPSVAGIEAGDRLVDLNDTPVAEFTLGQTWSLLQGSPGQEHKLTIAHAGKPLTVVAKVQHFLADAPHNDDAKGKSKKN